MDDQLANLKNSGKQYKDFYRDSTIWEGIKNVVYRLYEEEKEILLEVPIEEVERIRGHCDILKGIIQTIENYTTNQDGEDSDE